MSNIITSRFDYLLDFDEEKLIEKWEALGFIEGFEHKRNAALGLEIFKDWILLEDNGDRVNGVKQDRYLDLIPYILQRYGDKNAPVSEVISFVIDLCNSMDFPSEMFQDISAGHLTFEALQEIIRDTCREWADYNYTLPHERSKFTHKD